MYDKPHERFHKMELSEKHDFYLKLINTYKIACLKDSLITENKNGKLQMNPKRPVLLVSRY